MKKKTLIIIVLLFLLTACTVDEVTDQPTVEPSSELTEDTSTGYPIATETQVALEAGYPVVIETQSPATAYPVETESTAVDLETAAAQLINALAEKDMTRLANFVHPEMGVRFSPYGFVREEHQVFMPGELDALIGSEQVYTWGAYDGTGDPIDLTFDDYYQEFVYSSDFANPEQIGVNERIGQGNTINNIGEFYPGSSFVEYHFSGFEEQYEGMDWESLRLVFVEEDGTWWLVGIVHDEWTI
ncbi:MAG TPA: hypothetical protein DCL08_04780 [Anaerolineaceae bacterium]|nr:hypothetical protein [Anaerolineaceae bacterium]